MRMASHSMVNNWRFRPREQRTILFIGDLFVSLLALFAGLYFWGQKYDWLKFSLDFLKQRVELWFYFLPFIWMIFLVELYDVHRAKNLRQTVGWITLAALTGLLMYALVYLISPQGSLPRLGIGFFLAFASILTLIWRLIYIQIFTAQAFMRRVLVIGAGKAGVTIANAYKSLRPQPFSWLDSPMTIRKRLGKKLMDFLSYPITTFFSN